MKKKLWIFLLALALFVGALCAGAYADAAEAEEGEACSQGCIAHAVWSPWAGDPNWGTIHIKTLDELQGKITDGRTWVNYNNGNTATVTFLQDVPVGKTFTINKCYAHIILDLNGHKIYGSAELGSDAVVDAAYSFIAIGSISIQNGTIKSTTENGTALKIANGAVKLENLNVEGDLALDYQYTNNFVSPFLGGCHFTKMCAVQSDQYVWERSLKQLLDKGCYFIGSDDKKIPAEQSFGSSPDADMHELTNVRTMACDHKDDGGNYKFVDAETNYGALAKRCTECDNLCPHDKITEDGQIPQCTACGLSIYIKTTNLADKKPVGPYYYTGFDDAMQEILHVNKGRSPTLQLLADTESTCQVEWLTNDYDGIFIDLAGHTLTLTGNENKASYWVTFLNSSKTKPRKVVGAVNVSYASASDKLKLVVLNTDNNLTIETVNIGKNATAVLAGGGFGSITISADSRAKTLADLLAPDYCYYTGGDYEARTGGTATLGEGLTVLTNVYVAPCDHSGAAAIYHRIPNPVIPGEKYDAWTCPCGDVIFAARSTDAQGTVMYYPAEKFAEAFDHAASGTTVDILPLESGFPTGGITIDKKLTIDVGEIGSYADGVHFTLANGAEVTLIGGPVVTQYNPAQFHPAITVQRGGRLTVPATHPAGRENRINFTRTSGASITVESGGTAEFSSGTAKGVSVSGTVTVGGDSASISYMTVNDGGELTVSGSTVSITTINGGSVTVTGGKLTNQTTLNSGELIVSGGTVSQLAVTDGTVTLNSGILGQTTINGGTLTMNGGTLGSLTLNGSSAVINGGSSGSLVTVNDGGELTVAGGDFTYTIDIESGGEATLTGGTFNTVWVNGKLIINGAAFKRIDPRLESKISIYPGGEVNLRSGSVDHLYVSANGTLSVSGGKINTLETACGAWEKVALSDGEFGKIALREYEGEILESVRNVTYADFAAMLSPGKGYQKSDSTYAGNGDVAKDDDYDVLGHIKLLRDVTVTAAPFTGLTVAGDSSVTYGSSAALTASISNPPAGGGVAYQWYLDGTAIDGATGASYTTSTTLSAGSHTFVCEASFNGYVCRSSEVTVTVTPRKIYPIVDMVKSTLSKEYNGDSIATVVLSGFTYDFDGTTPDPALNGIAYTVTAYYADISGEPTADAGTAFWLRYHVTLSDADKDNYEVVSHALSSSKGVEITQDSIGYASFTSTERPTILNKHQKTYQITLKDYLPPLTVPCEFGDVTYSGLSISLIDYYTDRPPLEAKLENGILTLPILYNDTEQTDAGEIQLTVHSTNYKDFTLIIMVDATNKTLPTGTAAPSRTTLTYGEKLSDIVLSGEMKDGNTVVVGTFQWDVPDPDAVLDVGEHDVRWVFLPDEDETYLEVTGTVTITVNPITYSVSVAGAEHGTVTSSRRSAAQGQTVTVTVTPEEGYVLDTLTVTDARGNEIALTVKGDGRYTFKIPGRRVTVTAAFKAATADFPFTDVKEGGFYYDAVHWAWEEGITDGWGRADTFAPAQDCTRAQIVTFLWRAAGSPVVNYLMPFADVDEGAWYAEAVRWAASEGIAAGYGRSDLFAPDAPCTRAQAVTFLFRALEGEAGESSFSDVPAGAFYADAVGWAWENGITEGIGGGKFGPGLTCQRAQIVTLLYRALVK